MRLLANTPFVHLTSFIIVLNKNSHPQLKKAVLHWVRIWLPKISKCPVSVAWQRFFVLFDQEYCTKMTFNNDNSLLCRC